MFSSISFCTCAHIGSTINPKSNIGSKLRLLYNGNISGFTPNFNNRAINPWYHKREKWRINHLCHWRLIAKWQQHMMSLYHCCPQLSRMCHPVNLEASTYVNSININVPTSCQGLSHTYWWDFRTVNIVLFLQRVFYQRYPSVDVRS